MNFFVNYQLDEQNDKIALTKNAHCKRTFFFILNKKTATKFIGVLVLTTSNVAEQIYQFE